MPTPEINYRAASGSIIRTDMVQTRLGTITAIAELFPRFKDDYNVLKAIMHFLFIQTPLITNLYFSLNESTQTYYLFYATE